MKRLLLLGLLFFPSILLADYYGVQQQSVVKDTTTITNNWYNRGSYHIGGDTYTVRADQMPLYIHLYSTGSINAVDGVFSGSLTTEGINIKTRFDSIGTSTAALKTQIDAVAVSTGATQTSLNAIIISTGALKTQIDSVAVSTGTINTSLSAVILSTGAIQTSLNAVIVSTGALQTDKVPYSGATGDIDIGGYRLTLSSMTMNVGVTDGYYLQTDASGNATWAEVPISTATDLRALNNEWTGTQDFQKTVTISTNAVITEASISSGTITDLYSSSGTFTNTIKLPNYTRIFGTMGNAQNFTGNVWTQILFDADQFDSLSEFDIGTSSVTIQKDGMYLIHCGILMVSVTTGDAIDLFIYKNGASIGDGYGDQQIVGEKEGLDNVALQVTYLINLEASDVIDFRVYINSANTGRLEGADINHFFIMRIPDYE